MEKNRENEEKNLLAAWYGGKAFLKIKQCLEIGKILFAFVSLEDSKQHIDVYMKAEEFGACLMSDITGLRRAIAKSKADALSQNKKYPEITYTSPMGGNATANNGSPVSRYFTISSGSSKEIVFQGIACPATQNNQGAFIPEKGKQPLCRLTVGIDWKDLQILQYKWHFLEQDYMSKKYSFENMKSSFKPQEKENSNKQNVQQPNRSDNSSDVNTNSNIKGNSKPDTNTSTRAGGFYTGAKGRNKPVPEINTEISVVKAESRCCAHITASLCFVKLYYDLIVTYHFKK